jgi:hypothetical protein
VAAHDEASVEFFDTKAQGNGGRRKASSII